MIGGLKPYPQLKDSGLPWSDQVPEHWDLVPNRATLRKRKVLVGEEHGRYELLSLTKAGVVVRDVSTGRGKFSADVGTSQEVRVGDLVLCLFDVPETPRTVGLSAHNGMITGAYSVFECRGNLLARFIEAFYIAMDDRKLLSPLYSGLRNTIPPSVFLGVKTPIPPPAEQAAIVRFLDHADRRIQRYIRAKQKLIRLLEEQKQAIIHRAVIRGMDDSAALKPSGVEWLGDVPAHWEVVLNQRIFKENIRPHGGRPETPLSLSQREGLVASSAMKERSLQTSTYANWKVAVPGDLVVNRFKAHLGVFFACSLRGMVSFHYGVFEPRREMKTQYFEHLFHARPYRAIFAGRSNGMTLGLQNLSNQNFYNVKSLVPPIGEQAAILEFIQAATRNVAGAAARAQSELSLLREYRTRLFADVVTGKLDVREAAARLPEEVEDVDSGVGETEPAVEEYEEEAEELLEVAKEAAE